MKLYYFIYQCYKLTLCGQVTIMKEFKTLKLLNRRTRPQVGTRLVS